MDLFVKRAEVCKVKELRDSRCDRLTRNMHARENRKKINVF